MEKLITINEAATLLGVCRKTLINWDKNGKLKAYKTAGKHRRYRISELERFLKQQNG